MIVFIIIAAIIAVAAIIFAVQNSSVITVGIFLWEFEGSLALILLLTFLFGLLAGVLFLLPSFLKKSWHLRKQSKQLQEAERRQQQRVELASQEEK